MTLEDLHHKQADDDWAYVKLTVGREGAICSQLPGWTPRAFMGSSLGDGMVSV